MNLEEYVGKWWNLFDKSILADILNSLNRQYNASNINIFPDRHDIFKAFHKCKYDDCKVVMLGMAPYEQKILLLAYFLLITHTIKTFHLR